MGRPVGQLERALEALVIDIPQEQRIRERGLRDGSTGEYEQQLQVQLAGSAGALAGFTDKQVNWEIPFLNAPAQRRSELDRPHFTSGFEITSNTPTLVHLGVHLLQWTITEELWYVGATLRFSAYAPLATDVAVPYSAIAHLAFRGYGAPAQGDEVYDG